MNAEMICNVAIFELIMNTFEIQSGCRADNDQKQEANLICK